MAQALFQRQLRQQTQSLLCSKLFHQMQTLNHPADFPQGNAAGQLNLRQGLYHSLPAAIQPLDFVFVSATLLDPGIDHTAAT